VADLTTRPYEPDDAAAFTALMNTIQEAAGGRAEFTVDETRSLVKALVADLATDTRLVFDGDGTLVAGGIVTTPPAGGFRADIIGGVHPDRHGEGLGRDLLTWQYERATEIHADRASGVQWQVETGTLAGEPSAPRLFDRLGFAPVRYYFDMVAPTSAANPLARLPEGLRSVEVSDDLSHAIYEAHVEAFADHWGYQRREYEPWYALSVGSPNFRPELSRVALDGDQIAGYVLGFDHADPDCVYVGTVGTRRPWRRKGLASALLAEVISAAGKAGMATARLGVDADSPTGAVGVYERAGFVQEHTFVAYRRPIPA
jgi:GNAT superfamily N-acetyltransferase